MNDVTDVSAFAFLIVLWEWLARRYGTNVPALLRRMTPGLPIARGALAALPLLLAGQVALLAYQAHVDTIGATGARLRALPLPVFDGDHGSARYDVATSLAGFALGALESIALGLIFLALANGVVVRARTLAAAVASLAVVSLLAPVLSTTDPYEYVATGLLGLGAYAPPHDAFAGTPYAPYARTVPLTGVIYGPLWVIVDTVQTSLGSTIAAKIEALRLTNVLFVFAFLAVLRACRVERAVLAVIALDPALWYYTVANPHADIQGLLLLASASYAARRSNVAWAIVFVAAAGLIKLPYVVIGGAMLVPLRGPLRRIAVWATAIGLVLAISYVVRGHAYAQDVSTFATVKSVSNWSNAWIVFLPVVVAAVFALLAFERSSRAIALLFNQAGPIAAPWYLYWGLPYALASGCGGAYVVAMPFLAALRDDTFDLVSVKKVLILALALALAVDRSYDRHRSRAADRLRSPDAA
ncbi:MAG: hypothetical protein NVSMB21_12490 [Vulcanimicrobiaceae bacterium]